jgi:hypothetical protein
VRVNSCLILGAGRSGTSLIGQLLTQAGYILVRSATYAPDEGNPFGYYEDLEVNAANDAMLARFGPRWKRIWRILRRTPQLPTEQGWLLDLNPRQVAALTAPAEQAAIFKRLFSQTPFAYKDPRFSFTLGALASLLPKDTAYICVFRDPRQVIKSTQKHARRNGIELDDNYCYRVWEAHYRCLLEHHQNIAGRWLFVSYDQLIDRTAIVRMEEFLDLRLDRELIKPELNRVKGSSFVPDGVARLFERLEGLAEGSARIVRAADSGGGNSTNQVRNLANALSTMIGEREAGNGRSGAASDPYARVPDAPQ